MGKYPRYFDNTYVNLVKASEASGSLAQMLDRIAQQARAEMETRSQVRGAMAYPLVMLLMSFAVSLFLLTYIFPKLTPMFATRGMELPLPTQLMMIASNILLGHPLWVVAVVVAVGGSVLFIRRQPWARRILDAAWIRLPILGPMLQKVAISRSLRTLATSIQAGVPVLDAIELSARVASNVHYEECWLRVGDRVQIG